MSFLKNKPILTNCLKNSLGIEQKEVSGLEKLKHIITIF